MKIKDIDKLESASNNTERIRTAINLMEQLLNPTFRKLYKGTASFQELSYRDLRDLVYNLSINIDGLSMLIEVIQEASDNATAKIDKAVNTLYYEQKED